MKETREECGLTLKEVRRRHRHKHLEQNGKRLGHESHGHQFPAHAALAMGPERFIPPEGAKDTDTLTKISLALKQDPVLPTDKAEKIARTVRSMYEIYVGKRKAS